MIGMEKPETGENKDEWGKLSEKEKVTLSKEEHEKLVSQLKELEGLREKFLRSAADYDNARKRFAKEREEFIRFSQEKLIRDILPILDNFERALLHSEGPGQAASDPPSTNANALVAGVQLIWKQLLDVLTAQGLKRFSSEGRPFDPHLHEAVDQEEGEGPEGVILKEILPGYLLHDRVLRPAKVRIRVRPQGTKEKAEEKEEELT